MPIRIFLATLYLEKIRFMPLQLREFGFHVENHATQWHGCQHEIQFQDIVVAWIQLTLISFIYPSGCILVSCARLLRSHT